jgi:hypothetical protein
VVFTRPRANRRGGLSCSLCREQYGPLVAERLDNFRLGFYSSANKNNPDHVQAILKSRRTVDEALHPDTVQAVLEMEEVMSQDYPGGLPQFPRVYVHSPSMPGVEYSTQWIESYALAILQGRRHLDCQRLPYGVTKISFTALEGREDEDPIDLDFEFDDGGKQNVPILPGFHNMVVAGTHNYRPGMIVMRPDATDWDSLAQAREQEADMVECIIRQIKEESVVEPSAGLFATDIRMLKDVPHDAVAYCVPETSLQSIDSKYLQGESSPTKWDLSGVPEEWSIRRQQIKQQAYRRGPSQPNTGQQSQMSQHPAMGENQGGVSVSKSKKRRHRRKRNKRRALGLETPAGTPSQPVQHMLTSETVQPAADRANTPENSAALSEPTAVEAVALGDPGT